MVAPQVPTGRLIRQAILDHKANSNRDDAMRVVGFGQGVVGRVGVEELFALGALMLRVDQMNVMRPIANQVAEIVQDARESPIAETRFSTARTWPLLKVATAWDDLGFR